MDWHPFAERFPMLEGAEWEAFKASINKTKGPEQKVYFRMVNGKKQGLDGRNRYRACEQLAIKCPMEEVFIDDDEVIDFITRRNIRRRHMTPELRQEVVAELRSQGKSTRQIAATIGVSQSTVAREVASTESNDSVENAVKVTGNDGKKRKSKAKSKKGTKTVAVSPVAEAGKSDADESKEEMVDVEGHAVPDSCLEAFTNLAKFKALDTLAKQLQAGMDELSRLPGGEHLRMRLTPTGKDGKTINKSHHLNELKGDIKFTRPHSVCPWCQGKGKGCKVCQGNGWVEKLTWDNAEDSIKAKLK